MTPTPSTQTIRNCLLSYLITTIKAYWVWHGCIKNSLADRNGVSVIYMFCLTHQEMTLHSNMFPRVWKMIPCGSFLSLLQHTFLALEGRIYARETFKTTAKKDMADVIVLAFSSPSHHYDCCGNSKEEWQGKVLPDQHARNSFTWYLLKGVRKKLSKKTLQAKTLMGEDVQVWLEGLNWNNQVFSKF